MCYFLQSYSVMVSRYNLFATYDALDMIYSKPAKWDNNLYGVDLDTNNSNGKNQ